MLIQTFKEMLRLPRKMAIIQSHQLVQGESALIFYNTAREAGILAALATPATADELASRLAVKNRPLFDSILEIGVTIGGLSRKKGKFALRGALSRAIAAGHPVADLVQEIAQYHGDVAVNAAAFIADGGVGDYLSRFGGVIAKSSRVGEFAIRAFIGAMLDKSRALRILEVGCGSGEYLKYYVAANPGNSGLGIDKDPQAAEIAGASLAKNGIEKNFRVMQENILQPKSLTAGSFDIVTSYSNIYYFSDRERPVFFRRVLELLAPGGRFMLATVFNDRCLMSKYFDVLFTATRGLYLLPHMNALLKDLRDAGFRKVTPVNIYPGMGFRGIAAYK